jgi:hypothetical protein
LRPLVVVVKVIVEQFKVSGLTHTAINPPVDEEDDEVRFTLSKTTLVIGISGKPYNAQTGADDPEDVIFLMVIFSN